MYSYKIVRATKQFGLKRCSKWYWRNHMKQYKYLCQLMTGSRSIKKSRRIANVCMIQYVFKWMKALESNFLLHFDIFLSHFLSLLSAFVSSKPFWNNYVYCEIIDHYFCWNATEKRKPGKSFMGPNR